MSKKLGITIEELINAYNLGLTPILIAEKFNYTGVAAITKRLKKSGIDFKRNYQKGRYNRTNCYNFDINYFEKIDSNEKAYFLGLMYADGSVTKLSTYLKLKDEDIIIKFKSSLNAELPIKYKNYNGYYSYELYLSSTKFSKDLVDLGCMINKTYILKFPNIELKYYSHFIRGYFDGDGCIIINKDLHHCMFDITSASLEFLLLLLIIISKIAITNGGISKEKNNNTYHLRFGGKQVIQIMNWLYTDSNDIYLKRKYNKYLILLSSTKIG